MEKDEAGIFADDRSLREMHRSWKEQGRVADAEEVQKELSRTVEACRSQEEDWRWLRQAKQGDEEAFDRLKRKHQKRVYAICYRWLGDVMAVNVNVQPEDAVSMTFMNLWRALPQLPDDVILPAYLYTIAVNVCISELRERGVRAELVGESLDEVMYDAEGHPLPKLEFLGLLPSSPPPGDTEAHQFKDVVRRLIAQLPQRQREVILLLVQGYSSAEIGGLLNMKSDTARSNVREARKKLREGLAAEGYLLPDVKGGETHETA